MWIIPKNLPSCHFAQDTAASKKDCTLLASTIESSLMLRSKPMPFGTWCKRWKKARWIQHLFSRMLKNSQQMNFGAKWTSLQGDTRANLLALQGDKRGLTTHDTSGHTSTSTSKGFNLQLSSLKTSKAILSGGYNKSLKTWEAQVIHQRGVYLARQKLAHRTTGDEYLLWATPNTMDHLPQRSPEAVLKRATGARKGRTRPGNLREQVDVVTAYIYKRQALPTPTARDWKGGKTKEYLDKMNRNPMTNSLPDAIRQISGAGHLNPTWVEWLMGLRTGWTDCDC
jgi:hypothetical protein